MRVAIVHYWLVGMRGGEKVVEALCDLYPQADIFTHVYDPEAVSLKIRSRNIKTTFIDSLPYAKRLYKRYLPLMPMALEQLDLRGYDLIISSESGPSKGIIPPANALHICYCHSPMRYIWNMFHDYRDRSGGLTKFLMPPISHYVRNWDVISASRVHHFVANSDTVARRIATYYRRGADVIHPPVDTSSFRKVSQADLEDYFLMVGELVAYKRPDLAVEAFNRSGRKLIVLGGGEMLKALRQMALPNVKVLGPQPFSVLQHHYARCRALIFPGEEDFGIVPVEAMASGRPVIAYGRGGATETVLENVTGVFFREQSIAAIEDAIRHFDKMAVDADAITAHAQLYGTEVFTRKMKSFINECLVRPPTFDDIPRALPQKTERI